MEIDEWLNKQNQMTPSIDDSFEGRTGVVKSFRLVDTKFGTKLLMEIDFNGDTRAVFLSRSLAKQFEKSAGSSDKWAGTRVKIVPLMISVRSGVKKKLFPAPVKEQEGKIIYDGGASNGN